MNISPVFGLFRKTRELEMKIETFWCHISEAGVLLRQALDLCFKEGYSDAFLRLKEEVSHLEHQNDSLRRDVENQLYVHMILPDMRSDILKLLEGCDKIINQYEAYLIMLSIERPRIPKELQSALLIMLETDLTCVSFLLKAARNFFAGRSVSEDIGHVFPIEHQVDLQAIAAKEIVFKNKNWSLARQIQLKEIIFGIEKISDIAENVADILTIMAVKHI